MVIVSLHVQTIVGTLAAFAALGGAIYRGFRSIGNWVNSRVIVAKLIRSMYFVDRKDSDKSEFRTSIYKKDDSNNKHKNKYSNIKGYFYNQWTNKNIFCSKWKPDPEIKE